VEHDDLLPGTLGPAASPAHPAFRPHKLLRDARRRAVLRQVADGGILLLLNGFFYFWESARLPLTSRSDSLAILLLINAAFLASCALSRKVPEWRARRIASTWSAEERARSQEKMAQAGKPVPSNRLERRG
jgi:hypothetical protein